MGTYTVVYWMEYYSYGSWYDAPSDSFTLKVVPNYCYGYHDFEYVFTLTEPTCNEEGDAMYECIYCGHQIFKTLPKAHTFNNGVVTVYPTPNSDGVKTYTCTTCGNTKSETYSKSHAVKITSQPKKAYARNGAKVSIPVTATGDGLTYQWYVKNEGAKSYGKSSCTGPTYSCTMSETANNRMIYCVVTDQYGNTVKTKTVALRMMASIVKQPASVTVANGAKAAVTVNADGNGLTYTWYVKNPGATKFTKSSVTGATYSCIMSAKNNGRQVYCVVTDQYGKTVTSNVVTLGMK